MMKQMNTMTSREVQCLSVKKVKGRVEAFLGNVIEVGKKMGSSP